MHRLADAKLLLRDAGNPPLASSLSKEIEDALHDLQAPTVLDQLQASLRIFASHHSDICVGTPGSWMSSCCCGMRAVPHSHHPCPRTSRTHCTTCRPPPCWISYRQALGVPYLITVMADCQARFTDAKLLLRDAGSPPLASSLSKEIEDALHDLQAPTVLDQLQARLPASAPRS